MKGVPAKNVGFGVEGTHSGGVGHIAVVPLGLRPPQMSHMELTGLVLGLMQVLGVGGKQSCCGSSSVCVHTSNGHHVGRTPGSVTVLSLRGSGMAAAWRLDRQCVVNGVAQVRCVAEHHARRLSCTTSHTLALMQAHRPVLGLARPAHTYDHAKVQAWHLLFGLGASCRGKKSECHGCATGQEGE